MLRPNSGPRRAICLLLAIAMLSACATGPGGTTQTVWPAARAHADSRPVPVSLPVFRAGSEVPSPPGVRDGLIAADAASLDDGALADKLARRPLRFEPNAEHADGSVAFVSRGRDWTLWLAGADATILLGSGDGARTVRVRLLGGDAGARAEGQNLLPGRHHYLVGSDPARWRRDVPAYARVVRRAVYPGIDLEFHGDHGRPEFDLVLAAGADPGVIRIGIEGADAVALAATGDLVVTAGAHELTLTRPVAYQTGPSERIAVDARFVPGDNGDVRLALGPYDPTRPLVIDPEIDLGRVVRATYLGGSNAESSPRLARDPSGNVYLAAFSNSGNYLTTAGAFDPTNATLFPACVVTKFTSALDVVYSTYVAGANPLVTNHECKGVAADAAGHAYLAGHTDYPDFPLANALQGTLAGGVDAFLAKLAPGGSALVFSTYLGGTANDFAGGLGSDGSGRVVITGFTFSGDFPLQQAFQPVRSGVIDAYASSIDTVARQLTWSTFIGGTLGENGQAVAIAPGGTAYVAGSTSSASGIATSGVLQPALGGASDGFVVAIDAAGSRLAGTYLGGTNSDQITAMRVAPGGQVWVGGNTASTNLPVTANALQGAFGGGQDGFIAKIAGDLSAIEYLTYWGGTGTDSITDIALVNTADAAAALPAADRAGRASLADVAALMVLVAGSTTSRDFPLFRAVQTVLAAAVELAAFVSLFADFTGSPLIGLSLLFSTFLANEDGRVETPVVLFLAGAILLAATVNRAGLPLVQAIRSYEGGTDLYAMKMLPFILTQLLLQTAVLPGARVIQPLATTFLALIASGIGTATGCRILPALLLPITLAFFLTDPLTNAVVGGESQPFTITAGAVLTFLIVLSLIEPPPLATTAAAAPLPTFDARELPLVVSCDDAAPSQVRPALNTIVVSAPPAPTPDMVSIMATLTNDGITRIPSVDGTGIAVVAASNVGAAGTVTVRATATGPAGSGTSVARASAPGVEATICETVPSSGACKAAPAGDVTRPFDAGEQPTFAVFFRALGQPIVFDPANTRGQVDFLTEDGRLVGRSSVAITTSP